MPAVRFDTNKFIRQLESGGVPRDQAEATAEALVEALGSGDLATRTDLEALRLATKADLEALRLATKADLEALRLATKADLEALRGELRAEIRDAKVDLIKWMVGIGVGLFVAQAGLIFTLARMLVPGTGH